MVDWMKILFSSLPSCVTITHLQPLLCDFAEHLPRGYGFLPIPWFVTVSSSEKNSQVAQWYKVCLPMQEIQEIWVWSLGLKDPLEKEIATHSSIVSWRIPWTEEPGGLRSIGSHRVIHDWATNIFISHFHGCMLICLLVYISICCLLRG